MTHEPEEPVLFDLPLAGPPPGAAGEASRAEPAARRAHPGGRRASRPESLPLFGEEEFAAGRSEPVLTYAAIPDPAPDTPRGPVPVPRQTPRSSADAAPESTRPLAPIPTRLRATFGDLAILLSVGAAAGIGATLLGATLSLGSLPALLVFLLSFSFLYCVVSLAFWGQTPGMAWCGLVARSEETEPLSFGQTAMRWLGHWLTWALLGLPGLLALSGRSLADRLSGSSTYELPLPRSSAG
jgi:uncharacterized RDD family membrane protein YckC